MEKLDFNGLNHNSELDKQDTPVNMICLGETTGVLHDSPINKLFSLRGFNLGN